MWSKIDDKLHSHHKPRKAGLEAMGLWTLCLSYCGDQLTDGYVPAWFVATWVPGSKGLRLADLLVAAGLWEERNLGRENGWIFHDYHVQNPSREKVLADREYRRKQKADQREQAKANRMSQGDSHGESHRVSKPPDPTRPDPK